MNQRILLPAVVIGTLFAALLTFVETRLPVDRPLIAFAVNTGALLLALGVYGFLMQKAAAATAAAATTGSTEPRQQRPGRQNRTAATTTAARAERSRGGRDQGSRGNGRGSERKPKRDAAAETESVEEAPSGPREQGTIKWFSGTKGYGFIIRGDGSEVFVHHRAIRDQTRGDLPDGQPVSFVIVDRDKGPQADQVQLEDEAPAKAVSGNR